MLPTSREASAAGRLRPNALVLTGLASFRVVGKPEVIARTGFLELLPHSP